MTAGPHPIPDALVKLMETKLDTLEKLELVLMLHDAAHPLSLTDAARELQIGPDVLRRVALDVQRSRLLMVQGDVLQLTASDGDRQTVAIACELFQRERHAFIEKLTAISMNRLRSMAARSFANAFRIRKKEDDDG